MKSKFHSKPLHLRRRNSSITSHVIYFPRQLGFERPRVHIGALRRAAPLVTCGLLRPRGPSSSTPVCYVCPPTDKPPQHLRPHRTHNSGQSLLFYDGPGSTRTQRGERMKEQQQLGNVRRRWKDPAAGFYVLVTWCFFLSAELLFWGVCI